MSVSKSYQEMLEIEDSKLEKILRRYKEEDREYIYVDSDDKVHYNIEGKMYNESTKAKFPMMCSNCKTILTDRDKDTKACCLHGSKDYPNVLEFKCKHCGNVVLKYCYHNADGTLKDCNLEKRKRGIIDENSEYWEFFK